MGRGLSELQIFALECAGKKPTRAIEMCAEKWGWKPTGYIMGHRPWHRIVGNDENLNVLWTVEKYDSPYYTPQKGPEWLKRRSQRAAMSRACTRLVKRGLLWDKFIDPSTYHQRHIKAAQGDYKYSWLSYYLLTDAGRDELQKRGKGYQEYNGHLLTDSEGKCWYVNNGK